MARAGCPPRSETTRGRNAADVNEHAHACGDRLRAREGAPGVKDQAKVLQAQVVDGDVGARGSGVELEEEIARLVAVNRRARTQS